MTEPSKEAVEKARPLVGEVAVTNVPAKRIGIIATALQQLMDERDAAKTELAELVRRVREWANCDVYQGVADASVDDLKTILAEYDAEPVLDEPWCNVCGGRRASLQHDDPTAALHHAFDSDPGPLCKVCGGPRVTEDHCDPEAALLHDFEPEATP